MTVSKRNLAASIRARLLDLSRNRGEAFDYALNCYATERLLHRLSCSSRRNEFVLKGATLLRAWLADEHRPTRDVDFLAFGSSEIDDVTAVIRELCDASVPDDGIVFLAGTVTADRIKDNDEYEGVRVRLEAKLAGAKIPMQIDIGFGDAVDPVDEDYPVLLSDLEAPRIRAYPRESVVAEKLQAMVDLGLANSRMKDFYDLDHLARGFDFQGQTLLAAIRATFGRRRTPIPTTAPVALTSTFTEDKTKQTQWRAFLRRIALPVTALDDVVATLSSFILPVFAAIRKDLTLGIWRAGGPWTPE